MRIRAFLPALAWLIAITYLSATPAVQLPRFQLFSSDKLAHAAAYALLAWLFAQGLRANTHGRDFSLSQLALVFLLPALYGAVMEWMQGAFFPNRFFEYDDMLANAVGAAIVSGWLFFRK